ncbi:Lrp/AsnC family transcriptional regulator [uncultured Paracoccus sp.]|uniref:Lrp/AsnC family transcriptional regulator n=1 Tax=uncultured Paracoccus sp. TaxID=189685 RepID=UPI0026113FDB|nr:Lrp/AsnC family transcriptional regulator [uncultured Paracoccus sp.]
MTISLDHHDIALLRALQRDGSMTAAALSQLVNLSPSQCARRRAALEQAGVIKGYVARLDAARLGIGLRAIVRVNLRAHGKRSDDDFVRFIDTEPVVQSAFSVSGDADYVLDVRCADLEAFAVFIHDHLLPHPQVGQVRSDIVLRTVKDRGVLDLRAHGG